MNAFTEVHEIIKGNYVNGHATINKENIISLEKANKEILKMIENSKSNTKAKQCKES